MAPGPIGQSFVEESVCILVLFGFANYTPRFEVNNVGYPT
jgi:hypothetical protein